MLTTCSCAGNLSSSWHPVLMLKTFTRAGNLSSCRQCPHAGQLSSYPHKSNHPHAGISSSNLATCPHAGYLCSCSQPVFMLATCSRADNLCVPSCWKPCLSPCSQPFFVLETCLHARNLSSYSQSCLVTTCPYSDNMTSERDCPVRCNRSRGGINRQLFL
jgi:hypothetical protein